MSLFKIKTASVLLFVSLTLFINASRADELVNWVDMDDAVALTKDKPIFVFGEAKFCGACAKVTAESLSDQEIAATINQDFVPVKLSSLGLFRNKLSNIRYENGDPLTLLGTPAYVFLKGGKYTVHYGYKSREDLQKLLTYFATAFD